MAIRRKDFTDAEVRIAIRMMANEALARGENELKLTLRDRSYRMLRLQMLELHSLGWREIGRNVEFVALRFAGASAAPESGSTASSD